MEDRVMWQKVFIGPDAKLFIFSLMYTGNTYSNEFEFYA